MKEKFIALLTFTSSLKNFGIKFIRVAILVVFVWIGGLKYFHYEADGIVPFVANSPFMSFFYAKDAPEYKDHKNPEGSVRGRQAEARARSVSVPSSSRSFLSAFPFGCTTGQFESRALFWYSSSASKYAT